MRIKLVGVLKALALGKDELIIEASDGEYTVRRLLEEIAKINPKLYARIYDVARHDLQPDIYVAVNNVDIRLLKYLDTEVKDGDEVLMIAYIHGG